MRVVATMKTPLAPGETLIREGGANLQRGVETVGGHLALTDRRLVFEPHAFNVQSAVESVPLARVTSTELCWTKFLGLLPIAPNSLLVRLDDGGERRFVLWGRASWQEAIEGARGRATGRG